MHSKAHGSSPSRDLNLVQSVRSRLGKRKLAQEAQEPSKPSTSKQRQPSGDSADLTYIEGPSTHEEDVNAPLFPPGNEHPRWAEATNVEHAWWTDGVSEGINRKPAAACIFIHAGAGYHSTANENLHLIACSDAARVAMKLLKAGAPAIEGVEAAIKTLEDKEITNAGFGSNLAIDGTVECDATIVDHLGRSGACGAVPNIKNPISLARLILQKSNLPLSLRRVPPNLLVGKGAKDFAWENGMPLVPNDWLVSRNARDRYERWKEDLNNVEAKKLTTTIATKPAGSAEGARQKLQRDHTNAIMTGTWNEGQPDSPANSLTPPENGSPGPIGSRTSNSSRASTPAIQARYLTKGSGDRDRSPLSFLGILSGGSPTKNQTTGQTNTRSPEPKRENDVNRGNETEKEQRLAELGELRTGDRVNSPRSLTPNVATECARLEVESKTDPRFLESISASIKGVEREDKITDTVGAIAIDQWGNMAAGSSSGGIGMKHRGRVGPAALVGVGTALIPANQHDEDGTVVAAVTSGTGEHMATTMASQKCADRLYHGTRRGDGGADIEEPEESVIMNSFIMDDFQNHPGVLNSSSSAAIGAMAIKQTKSGYYLYFAHNTDSFALASMSSSDRRPHCVMSRLAEGGSRVAQGARKISA
ncbi:nucleophile aminohydrolase [Xylariales sp. PMI_506]|nr:nucleophile aminohydrolase [Xylariales sp. PMI_506]